MLRSPHASRLRPTRPASSLLTCGTYGNVIRFLPPLSMPDHLLREGLDIVADALASIGAVNA